MVDFQTKTDSFGLFCKTLEWEIVTFYYHLVYLWSFAFVYDNLVYYGVKIFIFLIFGVLFHDKSGISARRMCRCFKVI
jgi:hypothetical protein